MRAARLEPASRLLIRLIILILRLFGKLVDGMEWVLTKTIPQVTLLTLVTLLTFLTLVTLLPLIDSTNQS
jgi:hypothetical protein